jgi:hypothetical protein
MTESAKPEKKSKVEIEQMVKANGGKIYQTHSAVEDTICVADKSKRTSSWNQINVLTDYRNRESSIIAEGRPYGHSTSFMDI